MRGSSSSRIRSVREAVERGNMRKKAASSSRTSIVPNNIKRLRSLSMIGIIKDIMRQRGKTPSSNIGQGPRSRSITNRSTESKKDTKKHLSSKGVIMKITKDPQKNTTTTTMRLSRHLPPATRREVGAVVISNVKSITKSTKRNTTMRCSPPIISRSSSNSREGATEGEERNINKAMPQLNSSITIKRNYRSIKKKGFTSNVDNLESMANRNSNISKRRRSRKRTMSRKETIVEDRDSIEPKKLTKRQRVIIMKLKCQSRIRISSISQEDMRIITLKSQFISRIVIEIKNTRSGIMRRSL
jgi:hypothetical protein